MLIFEKYCFLYAIGLNMISEKTKNIRHKSYAFEINKKQEFHRTLDETLLYYRK